MATLNVIEIVIEEEYIKLTKYCNLVKLDLDIYVPIKDSKSVTRFGTSIGNFAPIYGKKYIALPQDEQNLDEYNISICTHFPPLKKSWNVNYNMGHEWPWWRIELWHETCHQIQDQNLKRWNPSDGYSGHKEGWREAMEEMAKNFSVKLEDIKSIIYLNI